MKVQIPLDEIEVILKVGVTGKGSHVNALVHVDSIWIKVGHKDFKDVSTLIEFGMRNQLLEKVFETSNFEIRIDDYDFVNGPQLEVEFEPAPTIHDAHDMKSITLEGHNFKPYMSGRAGECVDQWIDKHLDSLKRF